MLSFPLIHKHLVLVNMDGGCIYIVCACTWLAFYNGITPTFANYLILVFCATLGSMGAAPVPASLFVLIMTSYQTTFGVAGDVPGLPFIIAIE
jgi:Na+/H+-dicarboxylate symporter